MSLRDLCDVAYVMQVEALERRAVTLSSAAVVAGNAEAGDLPDRLRAEFDDALAAVPKPAGSPRARTVAKALGLT